MDDLIDRQMAIDALEAKKDKSTKGDIGCFYNTIIQNDIDTLNGLPTAQPERKKGKWVLKPHEKMLAWDCEPFSYDETYNPERHSVIEMLYHCPICNYEVGDTKPIWKFCPMCGTNVREGEKNADD